MGIYACGLYLYPTTQDLLQVWEKKNKIAEVIFVHRCAKEYYQKSYKQEEENNNKNCL